MNPQIVRDPVAGHNSNQNSTPRATLFEPFYRCAVDDARIALDERFLTEVLELDESAVTAVARIRELLAQEPSIHGSKKPALPRG